MNELRGHEDAHGETFRPRGGGAALESNDATLRRQLANLVGNACFPGYAPERIRVGPLEVNYFSVTFELELQDAGVRRGVYVKIPKTDLRRSALSRGLGATEGDPRLALEEYQSLRYLEGAWRADDVGVRYVRPLRFYEELNALVTERAYAADACRLLRRRDLARKAGIGRGDDLARRVLTRIGIALRRFHDKSSRASTFEVRTALPKFQRYCAELVALGADRRTCERVGAALETLRDYECRSAVTTTLKGFDIRNVLIDDVENVFLLDPGKTKENFREADLARFLITWRILYWGSPALALGLQPDRSAEEGFLQGYFGDGSKPGTVLALFLIKELLKHWRTAYDSLGLKSWSRLAKRLTAVLYIDPFYCRQLARELRTLG